MSSLAVLLIDMF